MKKIKTFVTMLAAVAAMILLPSVSTLKASAAERATYYIDYDAADREWYVLTAADKANDDVVTPKSMQFFYNNVKCGDAVVISCDREGSPVLNLGQTRLGNVTILPNSCLVMIESAGIADFFALAGSVSSVSAPVVNAYVYDPAVVNFNYNVKDILLTVDDWESNSAMGGLGTVGSLKVLFTESNNSYSLYDFKKGTFYFDDGKIQTSPDNFSAVPGASPFQISVAAKNVSTLKDLFDEHYYADKYPDLKAAFGYNREALWTHYINCGIREARDMNPLLNVMNYRNQYLDLRAVFGDNWDAYLTHYMNLGIKEGRDSGTDFNAKEYADWYDDLKSAYGNNVFALWQHYQTIGIEWSRKP